MDMEVIQSTEREAIPAITEPTFAREYVGDPDDDVIVVNVPEERARAYPTRILHYHEMANDTIGERTLLITWCVICGSAIVYDRSVKGQLLTFAQSGKLADDAMVMFDRETGSVWKQTSGECFEGLLEGTHLDIVPSRRMNWETFTAKYPNGIVLEPPSGESELSGSSTEAEPIDYEDDFAGYREGEGFGRYALYEYLDRKPTIHFDPQRGEWTDIDDNLHYTSPRDWSEDIPPKETILGIDLGDERIGLVRSDVESEGGVLRTTVCSTQVVVFATPKGLFAYEGPEFDFQAVNDGWFSGDGARWDGVTGEADDGRLLTPLPTRRMYAFAWKDAFGFETLYKTTDTTHE